jgi:hypothetical protein
MEDKRTYKEGYADGALRVLEVVDDALEEIDERIKSADPMDLEKTLKILRRHLGRLRQ